MHNLLWDRASSIVLRMKADKLLQDPEALDYLNEEVIEQIRIYMSLIRQGEDIQNKAKSILKRHTDFYLKQAFKLQDLREEVFLKTVFSFHPSKVLPDNSLYPILIGSCQNHPSFFVQQNLLAEGAFPDEDDAISIKKCVSSIMQTFSCFIKDFCLERCVHNSAVSKVGLFLARIIQLYPFSQTMIV